MDKVGAPSSGDMAEEAFSAERNSTQQGQFLPDDSKQDRINDSSMAGRMNVDPEILWQMFGAPKGSGRTRGGGGDGLHSFGTGMPGVGRQRDSSNDGQDSAANRFIDVLDMFGQNTAVAGKAQSSRQETAGKAGSDSSSLSKGDASAENGPRDRLVPQASDEEKDKIQASSQERMDDIHVRKNLWPDPNPHSIHSYYKDSTKFLKCTHCTRSVRRYRMAAHREECLASKRRIAHPASWLMVLDNTDDKDFSPKRTRSSSPRALPCESASYTTSSEDELELNDSAENLLFSVGDRSHGMSNEFVEAVSTVASLKPAPTSNTPQRESDISVSSLLPKEPVTGILRQPTKELLENISPIREGPLPRRDAFKDVTVPRDARWTKISRRLVNPEALEIGKERFEVRDEFVIVLRVLTRDEIQAYAEVTKGIREAKEEGGEGVGRIVEIPNYGQFAPQTSPVAHLDDLLSRTSNHSTTDHEHINSPAHDHLNHIEVNESQSLQRSKKVDTHPNVSESDLSKCKVLHQSDDDTESLESGRSGTSSIASVTDSIFSFISGSSMSSVAGPQSAVDRLVNLILSDTVIKSLCTEGLGVFERVRFERNLRRLLKEFAIALRKEAETQDERHAANFVRVRARNSAYVICSSLGPKKKFKEVVEIAFENVSEESDEDTSDDEVDDLQRLEAFIRSSNALKSLRDNLNDFVQPQGASKAIPSLPHSLARHVLRETQSSKSLPQVPSLSDKQVSRIGSADESEPQKEMSARRYLIDVERREDYGKKREMAENDSSVSYLYAGMVQAVGSQSDAVSHAVPKVSIEDTGTSESRALKIRLFAESSIILWALNIVRRICSMFETKQPKATGGCSVQYKCKCGVTIMDAVVELQAGGAKRLQSTLQQSLLKGTSSSAVSRIASFGQAFSELLQGFSKPTRMSSNNGSELPMHEIRPSDNPTEGDNSRPDIPPPAPIELIYLLICYNKARYEERLLQLDLTKLGTGGDKALFESLRDNYHGLKKWPARWLSLRSLQSIQFVQFEMYKSELVDIKQRDKLPPPEDVDYRYAPAPPETIPPIGNNYLMHVFQNPDCADDDPLCLSKLPKKLKEKLSCKKGVKPGWGLQLIEGWDGKKLWILAFMFFGLGSLTFGIVWAVLRHSIQDAFAIAAYMVAFGTISIGTVQALLVM